MAGKRTIALLVVKMDFVLPFGPVVRGPGCKVKPVNFWWNIMDFPTENVIQCKVIPLVRSVFAREKL